MQYIELADYQIAIDVDVWSAWRSFLAEHIYSQLIVLVDENTAVHCLPAFRQQTPKQKLLVIQIAAGEQHKTIDTCQVIWSKMMAADVDRQALMVNLGGGVIGDMGGFCASTYKRGIDFVQFPTTILSQVDASVGGKLGIDFQEVKNSIGVFKNPKGIFIHIDFLKTLPHHEMRSGLAELLKHSLIADAQQWKTLQQFGELSKVNWLDFLPQSIQIKKEIVATDPYEKGLRKALNFGHTIGHAVESYFLQTATPLLHGEAIAIGMICEAYLSNQLSTLSDTELSDITNTLIRIYGHLHIPEQTTDYLFEMMRKDKKNEQQRINFSLLPAIGEVKVNCTASDEQIIDSLRYYQKLR